jgi:hypothetical protein
MTADAPEHHHKHAFIVLNQEFFHDATAGVGLQ